jgi:hypothetical protein
LKNLKTKPYESEGERIFLLILMLLHDLFHVGNTYRQMQEGVPLQGFSNEEVTGLGFLLSGRKVLDDERLLFGAKIHLITAFGQTEGALLNAFPRDEDEDLRRMLLRPYAPNPKNSLETSVVLVDVGGFAGGECRWISEGLRVAQETFAGAPKKVDDWLKSCRAFAERYLRIKLEAVKPFLEESYFKKLETALDNIIKMIVGLEDLENPQREHYERVVLPWYSSSCRLPS